MSYQSRVRPWLHACFGPEVAADRVERHFRFLEEALELVQSSGCNAEDAHKLVDYVFSRPVGEMKQEVGGVMTTLASLCLANGLDMHQAGEDELARVWQKIDVIREKQKAKPHGSPLPGKVTCALCGNPPLGHASNEERKPLCHDEKRDCYHLWTVHGVRPWQVRDAVCFHCHEVFAIEGDVNCYACLGAEPHYACHRCHRALGAEGHVREARVLFARIFGNRGPFVDNPDVDAVQEFLRKTGGPLYKCAGAACPGLPHRASDIPHPPSCAGGPT